MRKDWIIEYTMFVSSRDDGTRPFRRVNAKEFHEVQWEIDLTHPGRLVGEKSIDLTDVSWAVGVETNRDIPQPDRCLTRSDPGPEKQRFEPRQVVRKLRNFKRPCLVPGSVGWLASSGFSTTTSLRDILQSRSSLRVNEWDIPNAIFARKFGLYKDGRPLPPSIKELPVAEEKAMDVVTSTAMRGFMYWGFKGPFTPQLWFDSGLDYLWRRDGA